MKIDKIAFSCSEHFSPFWNLQARVWKTKFGIHPVCFLYGDKKKCNMSEEHGEVIELAYDSTLPKVIQLQFSRFWYPSLERDTTWLIGDIDLFPLQENYFKVGIDHIPADGYVHMNYSIIGREMGLPPEKYFTNGSLIMGNGGYDLPGHYHCAKGSTMKQLFFKYHDSYNDFLTHIISSKKYERPCNPPHMREIWGDHWMAEENYTSEVLWTHFRAKDFAGFYAKEYRAQFQRLEAKYQENYNQAYYPRVWNGKDFIHNGDPRCPNRLKDKSLVEIHCGLPFQKYEDALIRLLKEANMYD